MAGIDKIYVKNNEEYKLFTDWVKAQPPLKDKYGRECPLSQHLYDFDDVDIKGDCPVFNGHWFEDAYIARNCPYNFIQKRLKEMYGEEYYSDIKNGRVFTSPSSNKEYEIGRHFKILKKERGTLKKFYVEVRDNENKPMDYCNGNDTWNFYKDYIYEDDCGWCRFSSIKAIIRRIPKWNLPIGAIVKVDGRMNYVFQIKK